METDREEMMVEISESRDDLRTQTDINTNIEQPLQSTGSDRVRIRCYKSVAVCLVLLCVLLLIASIMLRVLIYTNNQHCHLKTKNLKDERDERIAKYNNISKLSEQGIHLCDGWIKYKSSLYFISSELKSWTESRRYCREKKADLIIINNKEEQDFTKKITDGDRFWIGLSDSAVEGRWKWVDGSTLTSGLWAPGQPNGGTTKNCAESFSSGWADFSCNKALKWICENSI